MNGLRARAEIANELFVAQTFIRFETDKMDVDSHCPLGIFQAAFDLRRAGEMCSEEEHALSVVLTWFRHQLEEPDSFSRSRKSRARPEAICWFKDSATDHLMMAQTICDILGRHGIKTQKIVTARPGYVVYDDEYQVAAKPFKDTYWRIAK